MNRHIVIAMAVVLIGGATPGITCADQFRLVIRAPAKAAPADDAAKNDDKAAAKPANDVKAAPKPRAAQRPVADDVLIVNANPGNQNPLQRQIRQHLEPILKVELSFVNRVAGLSDDERRALVAASVKWLDEFVVDFVKNQDRNQQQMWLQGVQGVVIGGDRTSGDPRESIARGVSELVAATLPKEKAAAYEKECAERAEFYRDVTIANLVQSLDEKVILSREQRKSITESLKKHWATDWAPQLEVFLIGNDAWISFPDEYIVPELTASQRAVLSRVNRISGRMFWGGTMPGMGGEVIDDIDLADVPSAAENKPHD